MRAVVDCVGPGEGADRVGEIDDAANVRGGADRIRRQRERDDLCAFAELRGEAVVVEREVVVHVDPADDDANVLLDCEPWRDVAVVVEPRDEHFVTGLQLACERAREEEVERRHALPEGDLVTGAPEERARLVVGEVDERRGTLRGFVRRTDVGVVVAHVVRDRVDHLVGTLGAAGAVEEREPALERGEARTRRGDVEHGGTHRRSSPLTVQV